MVIKVILVMIISSRNEGTFGGLTVRNDWMMNNNGPWKSLDPHEAGLLFHAYHIYHMKRDQKQRFKKIIRGVMDRKRGTSFDSFRGRLKRPRLRFEGEGSTGNVGGTNNWEAEHSFNNADPVHVNSASTDAPLQEIRNTIGSPHDEVRGERPRLSFEGEGSTGNAGSSGNREVERSFNNTDPVHVNSASIDVPLEENNIRNTTGSPPGSPHDEEGDANFSDVSPLSSPESRYGKRELIDSFQSEVYNVRNRKLRHFRVRGYSGKK